MSTHKQFAVAMIKVKDDPSLAFDILMELATIDDVMIERFINLVENKSWVTPSSPAAVDEFLEQLRSDIRSHLQTHGDGHPHFHKVPAIKALRRLTGSSVREAKSRVDAEYERIRDRMFSRSTRKHGYVTLADLIQAQINDEHDQR